MSLILDALNKADRQRDDKEPVPNLTTYHAAPTKPKLDAGIPTWMLYSVLGLLVLVVVGLGLLLVQGNAERAPSVVADTASVKPSLDLPVAKAAEIQPSLNTPFQGRQKGEPLGNVPLGKGSEPVISPEVAAIYGQVGDDNAATPKDNIVDDLYSGSATKEKPQRQAKASNTQKAKPATDLLIDDRELQALWRQSQVEGDALQPKLIDPYAKLPYLHQLPESFQSRIPTLMYQNHIYSAKAGAVILNGKTYRKGEEIAPDLLVEAVTEEELVLSYLNKPFKLAALSSWVQMD